MKRDAMAAHERLVCGYLRAQVAVSAQVQKLVQQFLKVEDSPGPRGKAPGETPARKPKRKQKRDAASLGLYDASVTGEDQGLQTVQAGAGGRLPVLHPTLLLNSSEFAYAPLRG